MCVCGSHVCKSFVHFSYQKSHYSKATVCYSDVFPTGEHVMRSKLNPNRVGANFYKEKQKVSRDNW